MTAPTLALRDAVRAILAADTAIQAIAADRIHDRVPAKKDGLTFPFLAFGPMRKDRIETGCEPAWTLKLRLYAASTEFERDQAWELIEAAGAALEGVEPVIEGPFVITDALRVAIAGDAIEPGLPRSAFLDLTALASPAA